MKRTRVTAAALTTLVAVGALTACSADSGDGSVTISIMAYKQSGIDALKEEIQGFEAAMKEEGRDITVELISDELTDEQFKTKITQQLIAGEAPDLLDIGDNMVAGFAGAGYLAPLDDYLEEWDDWDHWYPQFQEAMVRQDGHIYALVHDSGVNNFFYRKDVLTELGIDASQPETWDDMIARLKQIKEQTGQPPIVIPAGTAWGGGTWSEGFQPILGGTADDYYDLETGKWNLQSDGFRAVFDLYEQLVVNELLPTQDLLNPNPWEPTKYDKFPAGELQVAAQGTWGWKFDWGPEGATPIPELETRVDTWLYPGLRDDDEPFVWSGMGFGYAIPESSEHKDEAMLLAQYLSSGEPLARMLVTSGAASPRDDMADIAPYSEEPKLLEAAEDMASGVFVVTGDGSDQVSQAVASATELILTGEATGEEAYEAFVEDATDLLGPNLVQE